jgi:predicted transcriptional regulator
VPDGSSAERIRANRTNGVMPPLIYRQSAIIGGVDRVDETAGGLLRRARVGAGLSQAELAFRAGVAQSVISAYEAGRRQPSLPTLARLIDAAGCDLVVDIQPQPPA